MPDSVGDSVGESHIVESFCCTFCNAAIVTPGADTDVVEMSTGADVRRFSVFPRETPSPLQSHGLN